MNKQIRIKVCKPWHYLISQYRNSYIISLQAYENYSFEELRYATPAVPRPSENMLVRSADDGTYLANWTPSSIGFYNIYASVDGFETGSGYDKLYIFFNRQF